MTCIMYAKDARPRRGHNDADYALRWSWRSTDLAERRLVFRGRERSAASRAIAFPHGLGAPPGYGLGAIREDHNMASSVCKPHREVVTAMSAFDPRSRRPQRT
jgi:hypothetical protein